MVWHSPNNDPWPELIHCAQTRLLQQARVVACRSLERLRELEARFPDSFPQAGPWPFWGSRFDPDRDPDRP
jgi:hypothetical protein